MIEGREEEEEEEKSVRENNDPTWKGLGTIHSFSHAQEGDASTFCQAQSRLGDKALEFGRISKGHGDDDGLSPPAP